MFDSGCVKCSLFNCPEIEGSKVETLVPVPSVDDTSPEAPEPAPPAPPDVPPAPAPLAAVLDGARAGSLALVSSSAAAAALRHGLPVAAAAFVWLWLLAVSAKPCHNPEPSSPVLVTELIR